MKKINWNSVAIDVFAILGMALVGMMILFGAGCFKPEPEVKYVEVIQEQKFDTSIIESNWCSGADEGERQHSLLFSALAYNDPGVKMKNLFSTAT